MPALHHFIGAWKPATDLPVARRLFAAMPIGGKILIAGGYPATIVCYLYDPVSKQFSTTGELPGTTYFASGAANTDNAYLVGGYISAAIATVYKYNRVSAAWTTETALPAATYSHSTTMLPNGKLLVCGGVTATVRTVNCYTANSLVTPLVWSAATPLPVATYGHAACLLADGRVFICGGATTALTAASYLLSTDGLDWSTAAPMPSARIYHQATLLSDGRVFVSGGVKDALGNASDSCWIYDPATNSWVTTTPLPATLQQHGQVKIGPDIMVIGGFSGFEPFSACYTRPDQQVLFTHKTRPTQYEREWLQESGKTTAGLPVAQLPYAKTINIPFSWNNMPRTDKDRLLSFWDAMNGMATEFNAVYHDGTTIAGRFGVPELTFTERSTDVFSTTVPFLVITP